jgi:type II secretory pathway pseudopilin PulG
MPSACHYVSSPTTARLSFRARFGSQQGFTLVVTLLMMILLTILALGLLSLSTISLRQSSAGAGIATARANARMALMLAIGELQKTAGTDKAVTATSEIISATPQKPNLTGVWRSWDYLKDMNLAGASPDYAKEKSDRFQSWLVSDPNPIATRNPNYANTPLAGETIELIGEGALGESAVAGDKVLAGRVPVIHNGKIEGAFAWHVADESVKARIAAHRDPSLNKTLAQKLALLAGHRPDVSVMEAKDQTKLNLPKDDTKEDFNIARNDSAKFVNLAQIDLFAPGSLQSKKFRHDVTPYSLGLLTDARNGGLKKDLTTLFEANSLPAEYATAYPPDPAPPQPKPLYKTILGDQFTAASDPGWSALANYYKAYAKLKNTAGSPGDIPTFKVNPNELDLMERSSPPVIPDKFSPVPVIQKVELLVSLVVRPVNRNSQRPNVMYVHYTPLVTLHNPYNVALEFDVMRVEIRNIPLGIKFYINNEPQSGRPATDGTAARNNGLGKIGTMWAAATNQRGEKSFMMDISGWKSHQPSDIDSSRDPVIMNPGQSLICAPYLDPGAISVNGNATANTGIGIRGDVNNVVPKAKPGFVSHGVGFSSDLLVCNLDAPYPTVYKNSSALLGGHMICVSTGSTAAVPTVDRFHCEFALLQPDLPTSVPAGTVPSPHDRIGVYAKFGSGPSTAPNPADAASMKVHSGIECIYTDQDTLNKRSGYSPEAPLRYPKTGDRPVTEIFAPLGTPLPAQVMASTICVISLYARTSRGGVYETGTRSKSAADGAENKLLDGRLAGQPFLFQNPSLNEQMDMKMGIPGEFAREFNFQPLPGNPDDLFSSNNNRVNMLTANTALAGIKSGSLFELPAGPMQTIADFRRSNALTTPFRPSFVQPVANSSVSPMMSTSSVKTSDGMLDHSVLANHALYDNFYFSTLAPELTGSTTLSADRIFRDFMTGVRALPNQGYQSWLPEGETVETLATRYFGSAPSADTFRMIASCQMVKGAFNVNSTSVQAWRAMLSSMSRSEVNVLWTKSGVLKPQQAGNTPILPMSLPNGGSTSQDAADADMDLDVDGRSAKWNGYRELTPAEIKRLAECIVEQVRNRGPFLSLSEFVNRRIGDDSSMTRGGALQSALTESEINQPKNPSQPGFLNQVRLTPSDFSVTDGLGGLHQLKTPPLAGANPAEGAPGWINQGDLMRILEPAATVRSDTFVIRTCGESIDGNGKIIRAYAEAIVQRVPEFVDPADSATENIYVTGSTASPMNITFGRSIKIISLRWLSASEI